MSPEYKWFVQADVENDQQAERVKEAISLLRGVVNVSEVNSEVNVITKPQIVDTALTLPGLDFEITRDILADQAYLPTILQAVLFQPYANKRDRLPIGTYNAIMRGVGHDWVGVDRETKVYRKSMADILRMSDAELLDMYGFGRLSLRFYKEAVQTLRDKFIQEQIGSQ